MTDRDRLIELIYCAGRDYDDYVDNQHEMGMSAHEDFDEWLADELLAKGCILPPCKVGDKVYRTSKHLGVVQFVIVSFEAYQSEMFYKDDSDNIIYIPDIGKTVFLTKEEAEEKLKELNRNG